MNKLKECPYCRGTAKIKKTSMDFAGSTIYKYYVKCIECGAATEKYNTYFGCLLNGKKFFPMTEREAITKAVYNWNNGIFDMRTRLSHMTEQEKLLWHTEHLLGIAWYGAMVPMESLKWKTAWKLREIAENKKILSVKSRKNYNLGKIAKVLVSDAYVVNLVAIYQSEYERKD